MSSMAQKMAQYGTAFPGRSLALQEDASRTWLEGDRYAYRERWSAFIQPGVSGTVVCELLVSESWDGLQDQLRSLVSQYGTDGVIEAPEPTLLDRLRAAAQERREEDYCDLSAPIPDHDE